MIGLQVSAASTLSRADVMSADSPALSGTQCRVSPVALARGEGGAASQTAERASRAVVLVHAEVYWGAGPNPGGREGAAVQAAG